MIKITTRLESFSIETDKWDFEFPCPKCRLSTTLTFGEIRYEEYFICRGCHATIKAVDHLGAFQQLRNSLKHPFKLR